MPSNEHGFMFDTNFGFGGESLFTLIDQNESPPVPPIEGYFLELNGGNFLFLDGEDMVLL